MSGDSWREAALAELAGIKPQWSSRYGWRPKVVEADNHIDLFVWLSRPCEDAEKEHFVLRLRYQADFETAGRRESFLNPEDLPTEGRQFWPKGLPAFKESHNPPAICLEGTFGFHSVLHRDRDGRRARLNKLLMEIQKCLSP